MVVAVCLFFIKGAPIHKFINVVSETWEVLSYQIKGDQEIRKLFFKTSHGTKNIKQCKNCNVILLFAEGTSSQIITEDLTPNTYKFLKDSLSFENYFNHQAATFRGIRGSLISGFTYRGGLFKGSGFAEISEGEILKSYTGVVESLPTILAEKGYKSTFISPHIKGETLTALMLATGFDEAKSSDKKSGFDSDQQTYKRIYQEADKLHREGKRFLLAGYIVGTHHGLDSDNIRFGDGTNAYKNKFHNQDYWFGEFLRKYKNGPLANDTILIYTTDHSTYPAKEFQKTFQTSVNVFHDQIPLGIMGPGIEQTKLDARYRTSISLAPTILDLLGVDQYQSHFLGNSLFQQPSVWERYCAQGSTLFYVDEDGVVRESGDKEIKNMLRLFYSISG